MFQGQEWKGSYFKVQHWSWKLWSILYWCKWTWNSSKKVRNAKTKQNISFLIANTVKMFQVDGKSFI